MEKTTVYLIAKQYRGKSGVVQSCRREGNAFVLTILIQGDSLVPVASELDPGVFAVDNFLTEAEEADILDDIERSTPPEVLTGQETPDA